MEVTLEPLDEQDATPSVEAAAAAPAGTADEVSTPLAAAPAAAPTKRPRGRPKGSVNKPKPLVKQPSPKKPKKQKRPPSTSSESSSDSDEPPRQSTRSAVNQLMEDDVETQVLRFLNARKQNHSSREERFGKT